MRTIDVHGAFEHGAVPSTQPVSGLTKVVEVGTNFAGTGPPDGPGAGVAELDVEVAVDGEVDAFAGDEVAVLGAPTLVDELPTADGDDAVVGPVLDEVQPVANAPTSTAPTATVIARMRMTPPLC